ncbi:MULTISPECIES: class I adenylate-forming enzyme family protein [unclassified Microbacterium]|uniref:class I adenylate-forming enzyme family protein n=1 Tax=unclassified Microbacterium TaxID=2609290 RepID=UPI00214CA75C|nr:MULTISPECIES: class I adenylate-forming enzyme family protein [unclassified Microbacterium]MCR2811333.1 acyl--CoA ligase [Microbacterium sp. zg.B185]WIM19490.1 class I adenylate-forming enzyme family protein [Microbacterium sp. zg-B185]
MRIDLIAAENGRTVANLAELFYRNARLRGDRTAILMGGCSLSYRDLWDESTRVAALLRRSGVTVGDRVMIFADNSPAHFVVYLASARLGAVFTPAHVGFRPSDLDYAIANSSPRVIVGDEHSVRALAKSGARIQVGAAILRLDEWPEDEDYTAPGHPVAAFLDLPADAPALITYTSGSTSRTPAPVTRSHETEIWNAETYTDVWDFRPGDHVLVPLPLSWVYGLTTVGLSALSAGSTIVLQSARDAEPLLPAIQRHGVAILAGTMDMYSRMVGELQEGHFDLSSLRHLYIGGESIVQPIVELVEHFTGIRPLQAYAATEVAPVLAVDPIRDASAPRGTAGRILEGSEIRLVDADGADVPVGAVGEAWLRGRGSMLSYWREQSLTEMRVTADGWYRSGDYLWRDPDGFYFMVGRMEDVILREGSPVSLSEVETAIAELPGIEDVVVVGVPDDDFGEALIAFVVTAADQRPSVDIIYENLETRIARVKVPREIYIIDRLPLGITGKRDRQQLREIASSAVSGDRSIVTMAEWLAERSERRRS